MTNVSAAKRLGYGIIDIAVFTLLTLQLAALLGWAPHFDFMQAYSAEDRAEYWNMLALAFVLVVAASLTTHAVWGRSTGKWILGARSVRLDGTPLGWTGAFKRVAAMVALAALVVLPGPIIGFTFGPGSEIVSSLLLLAALVGGPVIAVWPWHADGSPLLQKAFGYRTVNG